MKCARAWKDDGLRSKVTDNLIESYSCLKLSKEDDIQFNIFNFPSRPFKRRIGI